MPAKIVCVGDINLLQNSCGVDRSWPSLLADSEQGRFEVQNLGVEDATVMHFVDDQSQILAQALESDAAFVIIMLGMYDGNASYDSVSFTNKLRDLVDRFQDMPSLPHVLLVTPPQLFVDGTRSKNGMALRSIIVNDLIPVDIASVARQEGASLLNLHEAYTAHSVDASTPDIACSGGTVLARYGHQLVYDIVLKEMRTVTGEFPARPPPHGSFPPSPPPDQHAHCSTRRLPLMNRSFRR